MRMQLGKVKMTLGNEMDFHYVEGQRVCDDNNPMVAGMRKVFGDDAVLREYAIATEDSRGWRTYDELDAAIKYLEKKFKGLPGGPPDVVLGFSQGANLATLLLARAELRLPGAPPPYRCGILLSGSKPGWAAQFPDLFAAPLETPLLVASSDTDEIVGTGPDEQAKLFMHVTRAKHLGPGHRPLPADREEVKVLVQQMRDLIMQYCPP